MSRWFRHYAGMMRDEKLVTVAVRSKQPVERVIWVWGALLESASEINDNGKYELDAGGAAYFLRCDVSDISDILGGLESLGRLSGGLVVRWGDRQYSSDTAAERQRRYRERKAAGSAIRADDHNGERDSDVTQPSRDGAVTPQETDTELETDRKKAPPSPQGGGAGSFSDLAKIYPQSAHTHTVKAQRLHARLSPDEQQLAHSQAAIERSKSDADRAKRGRDAGSHAEFVKGLDTWLREGRWKVGAAEPTQITPMTKLDRQLDAELWKACERVMGKPAPTSDNSWSFRDEVIEQAREAMAA